MSSLTSHECAAEITNTKVTFCVNLLANLPLEYVYSFILPCKKVRTFFIALCDISVNLLSRRKGDVVTGRVKGNSRLEYTSLVF